MYSHLGLDWGEKVCGVAFGSSSLGLVIPSNDYHSTERIIYDLQNYLLRYPSIKAFVVGYPSNFTGQKTRISTHITDFIADLQTHFPTISTTVLDERNTTKQALQLLPRNHLKHHRDNLSAYTLLKHYFNQLNLDC